MATTHKKYLGPSWEGLVATMQHKGLWAELTSADDSVARMLLKATHVGNFRSGSVFVVRCVNQSATEHTLLEHCPHRADQPVEYESIQHAIIL